MNETIPAAAAPQAPPNEPPERPSARPSALSLRPPANRIEHRAIWWWMIQSLLIGVPLLAATIVTYFWWEAARGWLVFAIIAAAVFLLVGVAVEPFWRYRVHRWQTTPEAVYARSGWLVREWRAAPLSRVQTVDALRGPVEQMLGLSTLRVTTASAYGAISIGGLDHKVAERLAEELTEITEQTPGDAT